MRLSKNIFIFSLLYVLVPIWAISAELGDDGLHKQNWMRDTFKDLREDLGEANMEGKRLVSVSYTHLTLPTILRV